MRLVPADELLAETLVGRVRGTGAGSVAVLYDGEIHSRELGGILHALARRDGPEPVEIQEYRGRVDEIPDVVARHRRGPAGGAPLRGHRGARHGPHPRPGRQGPARRAGVRDHTACWRATRRCRSRPRPRRSRRSGRSRPRARCPPRAGACSPACVRPRAPRSRGPRRCTATRRCGWCSTPSAWPAPTGRGSSTRRCASASAGLSSGPVPGAGHWRGRYDALRAPRAARGPLRVRADARVRGTERHPSRGYLLAAAGAALFSLNGIWARYLLDDGVDAARLSQLRSAGAWLILLAVLATARRDLLRVDRQTAARARAARRGGPGRCACHVLPRDRPARDRPRADDPVPRAAAAARLAAHRPRAPDRAEPLGRGRPVARRLLPRGRGATTPETSTPSASSPPSPR